MSTSEPPGRWPGERPPPGPAVPPTSGPPPTGWVPPAREVPPTGGVPPAVDAVPPGYGTPPPGHGTVPPGYGVPSGPGAVPPPVGYGVPGPYAPPQPTANKRGCLIAAGIVGLVLLLGIGGCAVAIGFGFRSLTAPVDASNEWLDALEEASEAERLRRITCPAMRSDLPAARRLLDEVGWDGGQDLDSSSIVNSSATVEGTVSGRGGDVPIVVSLRRGSDGVGHRGWCVNGVNVG